MGGSSVKVKFNGIIEKRSGGCVPCGAKRTSSKSLMTSKMYILPSGIQKTFYVGREENVSESDGEFLLRYNYTDKNGNIQPTFTKVD